MTEFYLSLQEPHEASGKSKYRVRKDTGLSMNTIKKYIAGTTQKTLRGSFVTLARYYGVNWRDYTLVVDDEDPERKTPLVTA